MFAWDEWGMNWGGPPTGEPEAGQLGTGTQRRGRGDTETRRAHPERIPASFARKRVQCPHVLRPDNLTLHRTLAVPLHLQIERLLRRMLDEAEYRNGKGASRRAGAGRSAGGEPHGRR